MQTVKDIMTSNVVFVDPDELIEKAIGLMLDHGVSGLPVIDSAGQLLGVISEFDVLDIVDDFFTEKNKVYHHMTRGIETVDANFSITELAASFKKRSIRRTPLSRTGKLLELSAVEN